MAYKIKEANSENLINFFNNNEVNKDLLDLYTKNWDKIKEYSNSDDIVFQLACVPQEYDKGKGVKKLLVVGQEIYNWNSTKESARDAMLYTLDKENMKSSRSIFMHFTFQVYSDINNFKSKKYRKKHFAWTNLRKFCYKKDNSLNVKPNKKLDNEDLVNKEFSLLKQEIEIIKPDLVLFLTGNNYDEYIENHLSGCKIEAIESYKKREIAHVIHSSLPKHSYRTYHPNHFRKAGKAKRKQYLKKLVELCKEN